MKESSFGIIAVALLVIGIAVAGCSGTSPAPASGGSEPAPGATVTPAGGAAPASGTGLTGAAIAGMTPALSWVEYRMNFTGMFITIRYDKKNQSCDMRFEGDVPFGMPSEAKCGAGGHKIYRNPNDISPELVFVDAGPAPVTVPAGTFATAGKYTTAVDGAAASYWIAKGSPVLKMDNGDILGPMELQGWG